MIFDNMICMQLFHCYSVVVWCSCRCSRVHVYCCVSLLVAMFIGFPLITKSCDVELLIFRPLKVRKSIFNYRCWSLQVAKVWENLLVES